jgi:hypothetical protein
VNNPAQTPLGSMVIVAADQHVASPLIHDPWAGPCSPPWSDRGGAHAVVTGAAGNDGHDREAVSRRLGQHPVPKALH